VQPWLSVIVPTYQGARYLGDALDSVRREPLDGVELVAVDDGSTDATLDVLRARGRELPLEVLAGPHHGSWVRSTNAGLRAARGTFACFLHQDDVWLPGRLAAVRREIEGHPGVGLVLHHAQFMGPGGERLGRWRCPLPPGALPPARLLERLLVQNFIAIPAPTFRRDLALASGGLDEALWYAADWDLWLRLAAAAPARLVDAALAGFRIHPQSQTLARASAHVEMAAQLAAVLARHAPAGLPGGLRRAAEYSVRVNGALAAAAAGGGRGAPLPRLVAGFAALGPRGWITYLRDSRILERVAARLRMRRRLRRRGA